MSFKDEFNTYTDREKKQALWRTLQTLKTAHSKLSEPIIEHFAFLHGHSGTLESVREEMGAIIDELQHHGIHPRARRDDNV